MKKIIGIILLIMAAFAIIGGIANGSFASLGDQSIFFCIGYIGAFALMIFGGIALIRSGRK